MKSIKVSNLGEIRNELNKYKKGKKLDINQFNQVARLAWLGKVAMQPLDPEDPECQSLLLYVQEPDELAAHFLGLDDDLVNHMHILDGEQGKALIQVLRAGVEERAKLYQELATNDFYFRHFYGNKDKDAAEKGQEAKGAGAEGGDAG
jgi:hypothetical protein